MDILAQTLNTEWVPSIIQLITAGGFGAFAWYLVIKHIPSIEERHREERKEWRDFISTRDADMKMVLHDIVQSHQRLIEALNNKIDLMKRN